MIIRHTTRWVTLSVATALSGCTCGGPRGQPTPTASNAPSVAPQPDAPAPASSVGGRWNRDSFAFHSALAEVHDTWTSVTLLDREARCGEQRMRDTDRAIQLVVPTGPDNDLYSGRWLALPARLHGAGVSDAPAYGSFCRFDRVERTKGGVIRGRLEMSYRTGLEASSPEYDARGSFEATVCTATTTKASMPQLDRSAPVAGTVGGQPRAFPTFLAFVHKLPGGRSFFRLKGYARKEVGCYSEGPNTPYLHGPEIGPGPEGRYFAGVAMPARWILQVTNEKFGERSVHAGDGAGWIRVESVELGKGGVVRGEMMAATVGEDDPAWSFEVGGKFEATVCDAPYGMLVPP